MTQTAQWKRISSGLAAAAALVLFTGCGDDDDGGMATPSATATASATRTHTPLPTATPTASATPTHTPVPPTPTVTPVPTLDIAVCAPEAGPFSAAIDHPFFFLPVGTQWILQGEEEDDGELVQIRVEITSLDETEVVAGVTTRVVEEREFEDGELIEVSRNFFVRNAEGTVCYYGEDVDIYEDGEIVSHEGAWRAGVSGALPGILIPANPQVGQMFQQEVAPGVAEDRAVQVAAGETVEVPFGTFSDTIRYEESSPLDTGTSEKIYARGVGLLVDDEIERVSVTEIPLEETKIFIEVNATDGDAGIQMFLDGEGWNELEIADPSGETIFTVLGEGSVGEQGITELFFESEEPSFDEVPLEEFLARFPAGEYEFRGRTVEGDALVGTATFTHTIPDAPVLVSPEEDAEVDPAAVVVSWEAVADPPGSEIVAYQVIVEHEDPLLVFSVDLPATAASVRVPAAFLDPASEYKVEVLAIEAGGNQTISEREFETAD
jgi:hypothetical protein